MEMPADIESTVHHIVSEISDHADFGWDGQTSGAAERAAVAEIIKAALLAERLSATERALALLADPPIEALQAMWEAMFTEPWDGTQAPVVGAGFDAAVAAIRSQP